MIKKKVTLFWKEFYITNRRLKKEGEKTKQCTRMADFCDIQAVSVSSGYGISFWSCGCGVSIVARGRIFAFVVL